MTASLLLYGVLSVPTCTSASAELESLIKRKATELDGQEYCQFRMYDALSDLDGDAHPDFVVVFTIEGPTRGNRAVQFLAVFGSRPGSTPMVSEVGRSGYRVVTSLAVSPPDI